MRLFNRHVSTRSLTVFAAEALLIFGSVALAARLQNTPDLGANLWKIALVTVVCQLCLYYNDFYDLTLVHASRELVVRLLQAVGAASIVLAAMYFTMPSLMIGDGIFVSALAVFVVGILGWRLLFNYLLGSLKMEERILVVGTGDSARKVVRQILDQREFAYRVIGFIDDDASRIGERIVNPGIVGTPADMAALIADAPDRSDRRRPVGSAREAADRGIAAREDGGDPRRGCHDDLRAGHRQDPHRRPASELADLLRRLPRVEDDPLAEALDRSHVVAGARRPGQPVDAPDRDRDPASSPAGRCSIARSVSARTARSFTLCKFRSMRQDAEKGGTPLWATDGDNRITRVGRFIRKTRLDELPQIWNVLAAT